MTIRVLLADDQALLRETFRILIDSCPDMEVVGEAADGAAAVALARDRRPDVVVMDVRMPGTDGLAATAAICGGPGTSAARVLILTTFEFDEYVAQAIRAGASGFLGKDVSAADLLAGIRAVASGDSLLSPLATRALISRFLTAPGPGSGAGPEPGGDLDGRAVLAGLTAREREMMALAAEGYSNDEIAGRLSLSPLTVRTHIQRAMMKLHARDRAQLVVIAYQTGLVHPAPSREADPPR